MADVKFKPLEPLSDWIEYRLETDKLDPPVFRCRLRFVDMFNVVDSLMRKSSVKMGEAGMETAIEAVAAWDLTQAGIPIPCTDENKLGWLRPIIAEPLAGKPEGSLLGIAILNDARDKENFTKKLKPFSPGTAATGQETRKAT